MRDARFLGRNTSDQGLLSGNRLMRLLVILAILAASALVAFSNRDSLLILVGLLLGGIGFSLILLRYPYVGIAVIIISALLIPFGSQTAGNSTPSPPMLVIALMAGLGVLEFFTRTERNRFKIYSQVYPLFGLAATALLAFLIGQIRWFTFADNAPIDAQIGGLGIYILSAIAFILAAYRIRSVKFLKVITWLYLALGAIFILGWLFPPTQALMPKIYQYGSTSSLFWTWMVALGLGMAFYNTKLSFRIRVGLVLLTLAVLYVSYVIVPGWKSGWVPALVTAAIIFGLKSRKTALLVIIVGLMLSPFLVPEMFSDDSYSVNTRVAAWEIITEIAKVNPILGVGPANYYRYTPLFNILGYNNINFSSHNQYVDLIAQTGIIGLIFFLWFFVAMLLFAWKQRHKVPTGFSRAYVFAGVGGIIGTLVAGMLGDWILPFVYNIGFIGFRSSIIPWIFMGGLIALGRITSLRTQDSISSVETNSLEDLPLLK